MKLLKPKWISHEGNPIFCVDIHPDGSRFATGGQVDDTGRITIWNMAPVMDAKDEVDENVPKMLCLLDNHSGCVNSLRWSNNGKYLASGADDKFIMIWQLGRGFGSSTVFGSSGTVVNIEHWRCAHVLRGHTGDVLDISWSPDDRYLASGSVDNTVNIWNAEKFPELIITLKGHKGLVKGVTWDPVGKYFASQSDDKSLKIWRTSDWKLESSVTEPFDECGGTTHVLRLNWSPDGQYVVSAHAMNNGGPVAKIIERDGWKARMDFVGHRKAITCVMFNSRLFTKPSPTDPSKFKQYACCAIGSRDRSLSIWLTSLKRPLVVTHDLFNSTIMDLSWNRCGYRLMACSLDGTLAYLEFTAAELGKVMTDQEKLAYHKKTYGTSIISSKNNFAASIIENPEVLKVHQQQQQQERVRKAMLAQQSLLNSPSAGKKGLAPQTSDAQSLMRSGGFTSGSSNDKDAMMVLKQQKETRTKDGRRRITPLLIAPPLDISDNDLPSTVEPFTNSQSFQKLAQDNDGVMTNRLLLKSPPPIARPPSSGLTSTPPPSVKTQSKQPPNQKGQESSLSSTTTTTAGVSAPVKRKIEIPSPATPAKRGRKEKDKSKDKQNRDDAFVLSKSVDDKHPEHALNTSSRPNSPHILLHHPKPEKHLSLKVNDDADLVYEIDNNIENSSTTGASELHVLRCATKEKTRWEVYLTSPATALASSQSFICVACQNKSLHVFSRQGRRIMPCLFLSSYVAILQCNNCFVLAVTSSGHVNVWDVVKRRATIMRESMHHLLKGLNLSRAFITETGVPVISLSDATAYAFSESLNAWTQVAASEDPLQVSSSYHGCMPGQKPTGLLNSVQTPANRILVQTYPFLNEIMDECGVTSLLILHPPPGSNHCVTVLHCHDLPEKMFRLMRQTTHDLRMTSSKQLICTINHLENQLCSALALESSSEYHFWLMTYARYLVQSGEEYRLRELCEDLLGPCHVKQDTSNSTWQPKMLVFRKRDLLQEILPIIGSNLRFQRQYTEFKEQLEYLNRR